MRECIVVTGGGTGGHVYPVLAVLDEMPSIRVVWIGSGSQLERRILEGRQLRYYGIPTGKLRRYFSLQNIIDLFKIVAGFFASLVILLREKPKLVFSKGGYVSVPPVAAARLLRVPSVTHESDLRPGLATRINSRFADRVLVSFPGSGEFFDERLRGKVIHTGNPIRKVLLSGDSQTGRALFGCPANQPLLLVLGGSLGSASINRLVLDAMDRLRRNCFVVHQLGSGQIDGTDRVSSSLVLEKLASSSDRANRALVSVSILRARRSAISASGTIGERMGSRVVPPPLCPVCGAPPEKFKTVEA